MALLTYSSKGLVSLLTSGLVMLRHRYCTFTVFGAGDTVHFPVVAPCMLYVQGCQLPCNKDRFTRAAG
eukprot:scaffold274754_cov22-Tisochrysis_lutea.AAC.1